MCCLITGLAAEIIVCTNIGDGQQQDAVVQPATGQQPEAAVEQPAEGQQPERAEHQPETAEQQPQAAEQQPEAAEQQPAEQQQLGDQQPGEQQPISEQQPAEQARGQQQPGEQQPLELQPAEQQPAVGEQELIVDAADQQFAGIPPPNAHSEQTGNEGEPALNLQRLDADQGEEEEIVVEQRPSQEVLGNVCMQLITC